MGDFGYRSSGILALADFSEKIIAIGDTAQLFDYIIDSITEIIGCRQASIMMFDLEAKKLTLMKARGFNARHDRSPRIELADNVDQWLFNGGEVFALTEQGSTNFLIVFDEDERKYFDCELRIPIFSNGKLAGVLNLGKKQDGTEYSNQDFALLRILVNTVGFALERKMGETPPGLSESRQSSSQPVSTGNRLKIKRRIDEVEMIGCSAALQKIKMLIDKVAPKDVTVLITGESGTGKELVARAIHRQSCRHDQALVAMNCAALPENLVESELFGHEKGAFTGAHCQKKGKFEFADGGTLFLDEIGDMSPATQAKVLRVLQEGSFQRIGGNKTLTVDVRVIAATNKDLMEQIALGNFREDLYYRVNVVQIHIPPLRERPEDIPVLADYFLKKYSAFYGKNVSGMTGEALERLLHYDFPGNIRELQNVIERAVIMEQNEKLTLDSIPLTPLVSSISLPGDPNETLEELEKEHIKRVIRQVNYNKSRAARILGIARKTLRQKMAKYGL